MVRTTLKETVTLLYMAGMRKKLLIRNLLSLFYMFFLDSYKSTDGMSSMKRNSLPPAASSWISSRVLQKV